MRKATAHRLPDGMFEFRPIYCRTNGILEDLDVFRKATPPIPTDDKDLVEGQIVNLEDYYKQFQAEHLDKTCWIDLKYGEKDYFTGHATRTILRKKSVANLPSVQPRAAIDLIYENGIAANSVEHNPNLPSINETFDKLGIDYSSIEHTKQSSVEPETDNSIQELKCIDTWRQVIMSIDGSELEEEDLAKALFKEYGKITKL